MLGYIIYFLLSIMMGLLLLLLSIFSVKIRSNYINSHFQIFKLFSIKARAVKMNKKILLFHAASAGEYEQIQPILRGIDRQQFFIIQTFTSPTIYNQTNQSSLYDIKLYHPFDIFWLSYLFFKLIEPYKYIITRHDLWPGHILIANWFKVPIYYINANIHKNSIWYKKYFRFLSSRLFKKINQIIVPSKELLNNVREILPLASVSICRDTRFNQIMYLKNNSDSNSFKIDNQISNKDIIVFGSTDELDEKIIFNILCEISKNKKIILVPHEVDKKNIKRITNQLNNLYIDFSLFTKKGLDLSKQVLLIDTVGLLSSLYSLGSHAYVGGGFKRGVHSVLEPAAHGCIISCGPNIEMLDEAKLLHKKNHLVIINHNDDLLKFINMDYESYQYLETIKNIPSEMINLLTND